LENCIFQKIGHFQKIACRKFEFPPQGHIWSGNMNPSRHPRSQLWRDTDSSNGIDYICIQNEIGNWDRPGSSVPLEKEEFKGN